jgi:hypothetical protein
VLRVSNDLAAKLMFPTVDDAPARLNGGPPWIPQSRI